MSHLARAPVVDARGQKRPVRAKGEADVIIIGAGHNGLICACYLARAGLDVLVVEERLEAGGALNTEEATIPGFLHNLNAVFLDAAAHMPAIDDLGLREEGLVLVQPPVQTALALRDGTAVFQHVDLARTVGGLASRSPADARAWQTMAGDYGDYFETIVVPALFAPPARPSEQALALEGSAAGMELLRLQRCTPADVARATFQDEATRALALFPLAIPRGVLSDYAGLGGLVPLVVSGAEPSSLVRGGTHTLAHALWRALLHAGGRLRGTVRVEQIFVEEGRAVGVALSTGERVRARRAVVSAVDVHQTFTSLLPPGAVPPTLRAALDGHRLDEISIFGVHLALREAPRYRVATRTPEIDSAWKVGIGFETSTDFDLLWGQLRSGELPSPPRLYACCPTLFDETQAPPGLHTAFCWAPAPYALRNGSAAAWDGCAPAFADRCLEAWRSVTTNLGDENILGRRTFSPLDIERKLRNMRRGGPFMGRMTQDQLEAFRPVPALADGRAPVRALYLAGAGQHPGGGVHGACGTIAAEAVLDDLGIERWWS